jgi:hypothetical protein
LISRFALHAKQADDHQKIGGALRVSKKNWPFQDIVAACDLVLQSYMKLTSNSIANLALSNKHFACLAPI